MMRLKKIMTCVTFMLLVGCNRYPLLEDVKFPSDYTYIIGAGDDLEIFVWGNPDISKSVTVRPDGKITTPLVNELLASGKTPNQLAREIEKELAKFIRDPQVAIIVEDFQGVYQQQVRVIGQLGSGSGSSSSGSGMSGGMGGSIGGIGSGSSSGLGGSSGGMGGGMGGSTGAVQNTARALPYRKEMTLLDLVIAIGGIGRYADGNRATIIRTVDHEQKQFAVRIDDLIEDGDMTANVAILPGDILLIPAAFF